VIYLDANATAPLHPEVLAEVQRALAAGPGNASSVHAAGQRSRALVDEARERCATALQCDARDLVFTSGGTEADALALLGAVGDRQGRVVTTAVEHPAVQGACAQLARRGCEIARIAVDTDGRLDLDALDAALAAPGTLLCSVMAANNETGVLFPSARIGELCRTRGVPLHIDAVQAAGKVPLSLRELPADYVSLSGHKLRGPQGVGLLWARRGARLQAVQSGGHQERGRRAGTESVAAIAGLGRALELAVAELPASAPRVEALRDRLEAAVRRIPGAQVHGAGSPRVPNTLSASFEGCDGETLLVALDLLGICVSTGSACSAGSLEPSPVLLAMGVPPERARGALRFSLWSGNTAEEIDAVAAALPEIVARCRGQRLDGARGRSDSRGA
jgi:cysteine desulfurase